MAEASTVRVELAVAMVARAMGFGSKKAVMGGLAVGWSGVLVAGGVGLGLALVVFRAMERTMRTRGGGGRTSGGGLRGLTLGARSTGPLCGWG